jgi:transcriptional regulator with XRE-family HTH domain
MPRRSEAPDPVAARFGAAIREVRTRRGETLEDVAGRIPATAKRADSRGRPTTMDPKYLSEIEAGWHAPSIVTAKLIAEALDVALADLVRDVG